MFSQFVRRVCSEMRVLSSSSSWTGTNAFTAASTWKTVCENRISKGLLQSACLQRMEPSDCIRAAVRAAGRKIDLAPHWVQPGRGSQPRTPGRCHLLLGRAYADPPSRFFYYGRTMHTTERAVLISGQALVRASAGQLRWWSSSNGQDHYETLGVSRYATAAEIKKAYFGRAKECHPDLHPNDKDASARFQKIAEAYSVLSDDEKRFQYDQMGHAEYQHEQQYPNASEPSVNPFEVFRSVFADLGVEEYFVKMQEDLGLALEGVKAGNNAEAWKFVQTYRVFLFSVFVPLVVVLRFPALVVAAAARIVPVVAVIFRFIMANPVLRTRIVAWLWEQYQRAHDEYQRKQAEGNSKSKAQGRGFWRRSKRK